MIGFIIYDGLMRALALWGQVVVARAAALERDGDVERR